MTRPGFGAVIWNPVIDHTRAIFEFLPYIESTLSLQKAPPNANALGKTQEISWN